MAFLHLGFFLLAAELSVGAPSLEDALQRGPKGDLGRNGHQLGAPSASTRPPLCVGPGEDVSPFTSLMSADPGRHEMDPPLAPLGRGTRTDGQPAPSTESREARRARNRQSKAMGKQPQDPPSGSSTVHSNAGLSNHAAHARVRGPGDRPYINEGVVMPRRQDRRPWMPRAKPASTPPYILESSWPAGYLEPSCWNEFFDDPQNLLALDSGAGHAEGHQPKEALGGQSAHGPLVDHPSSSAPAPPQNKAQGAGNLHELTHRSHQKYRVAINQLYREFLALPFRPVEIKTSGRDRPINMLVASLDKIHPGDPTSLVILLNPKAEVYNPEVFLTAVTNLQISMNRLFHSPVWERLNTKNGRDARQRDYQELMDWMFEEIFHPRDGFPLFGKTQLKISEGLRFGPVQLGLAILLEHPQHAHDVSLYIATSWLQSSLPRPQEHPVTTHLASREPSGETGSPMEYFIDPDRSRKSRTETSHQTSILDWTHGNKPDI